MGRGIDRRNHRNFNTPSNERKRYKRKIFIAVEGKNKTEKLYFDNFDDGNQHYSITIARGNDTDPLRLVKNLNKEIIKNELDLLNGDKAFCVFDTDMDKNKNKIILEAKKYAEEKGICIITSNPCFEVWFLLHFEYTTASLLNNEVLKRLKNYISKYEKNVNVYPLIQDKTINAIINSKKLENFHKDNGKKVGTVEANPSSEVYKLVEYLLLYDLK